MKTLTCDVCRHDIEKPFANRNYFHMAHRDLCEPCHDELNVLIKPIIRTKAPFNYEWFDHLVQETIEQAIQKGKF